MTYPELLQQLWQAGYGRVERDDRILDVFPNEDREKGVELWERWDTDVVKILRVRVPFNAKKLELYIIEKLVLEQLLQHNTIQKLAEYPLQAQGALVIEKL
jgi:hypothetical protein